MKMWNIAKASHAGPSYLLSSLNFLANTDLNTFVLKVIITRILTMRMF